MRDEKAALEAQIVREYEAAERAREVARRLERQARELRARARGCDHSVVRLTAKLHALQRGTL